MFIFSPKKGEILGTTYNEKTTKTANPSFRQCSVIKNIVC